MRSRRSRPSVEATYGRCGRTVLVERNFAAIDGAIAALEPLRITEGLQTHHDPSDARCPTVRRTSSSRSPRRCCVARAICCRSARCRSTAPGPAAPRSSRSVVIAEEDLDLGSEPARPRQVRDRLPAFGDSHQGGPADELEGAPDTFKSKLYKDRTKGHQLVVQVAPDDCTGCGICVDVCPARSKTEVKHKSINLEPRRDHLDAERATRLLPGNP